MSRRSVLVLVLISFAGCGGGDGTDPAVERGNTLSVLYAGSDEWLFSPNHDDSPKFLMFEPFVTRARGGCSEIVGGIAESWEPNEDHTEWTTRLRAGVRWHDGVPVTAHDVARSLESWKHPDIGWYAGANVRDWEVLDSLTFRVSLARPGDWPRGTWDVIHPGHILEDLDPENFFEWEFWTRPIGNGPFRYVRHEPKTFVEVAANEDYYLGRPAIDRVIIQFQSGTGSGTMELRAGNVDMAHLPPLEARSLVASDARFNHYYMLQASPQWLVWNYTHPALGELAVRKALAHATDRESLAAVLGLPPGLPLSAAPLGPCGFEGESVISPREYDLDRASALLSEARWTDTDGDGIREKDGRPLSFELIVHPSAEDMGVVLADRWRRVGVQVSIVTLDSTIAHERLLSGEFEAIVPQTGQAGVRMLQADSPLGTLDAELTAALQAVRNEVDPVEAERLAAVAAQRYFALAPALVLQPKATALVAHRRVKGLGEPGSVLPVLGFRHPFGNLRKLRIENAPSGNGRAGTEGP